MAMPSASVSRVSMRTISPASRLALADGAAADSTPRTRTSGRCSLTATAMPEIRPPPPIGTTTAASSSPNCSTSSSPRVPWPATMASSLKAWTSSEPSSSRRRSASSTASSKVAPWSTTRAPWRRVLETLISGVSSGITTVERTPRRVAW